MTSSSPRWSIPSDADLVVIYPHQPIYHGTHPDDLRLPICEDRTERGLVTSQKRARSRGLDPCTRCWPEPEPGAAASAAEHA